MKFVALLRGINVGGKNTVAMPMLRNSFERMDFGNVRSYINSGNILFESDTDDRTALRKVIEDGIHRDFGLEVPVVLRDQDSLTTLTASIPEVWQNNAEMKTDVLFLWEEVDTPQVIDSFKIVPGVDEAFYVPGAIVWRTERSQATRSGLLKLIGTPLYKQVTIRNVNTVRKIASLLLQ